MLGLDRESPIAKESHMFRQIKSIADLERLVENEVKEDWSIDYKADLDRQNGDDLSKKGILCFLENVTAFANAQGGVLLVGITEEESCAREVKGIHVTNRDSFQLTLENLLRDSVKPRLNGVTYDWIEVANGRYVLVINVPYSLQGPHVVDHGSQWRFFLRHSNGKHAMDVDEVREAFLSRSQYREKAIAFRNERYRELMNEDRYVGGTIHNDLRCGAKILFHLVPAQHGMGLSQINPVRLKPILKKNRALEKMFSVWELSFEGLRAIDPGPPDFRFALRGQMLVSRDGTTELILGDYHYMNGDMGTLHSVYEEDLVEATRALLQTFKEHQIQPPFFAFLTVHSFVGRKLYSRRQESFRQPLGEISRDPMMIPPVVFQEYDADVPTVLKDLFDPIWNECGEASSWNYDEKGIWRRSIYD